MSDAKGPTVTPIAGTDKSAHVDGPLDKAQFHSPYGIAALPNGNFIVVDRAGHRVRLIDVTNKTVKTLAGTGEAGFADGPADKAKFNKPYAIVTDAEGTSYISDPENQRIRRVDGKTSAVSTLAGSGKMGFDDGPGDKATFYRPSGLVLLDDKLYVGDAINARIRCVDIKTGAVTTAVGSGRTGFKDGSLRDAEFNHPSGLALESSGTMLVADQGNHRIRRVDLKLGTVTTVAGSGEMKTLDTADPLKAGFNWPALVLADARGNIVVGQWNKPAYLRLVTKSAVTTVQGVKDLRGITIDSKGQLFASGDSQVVRIDGLLPNN